MEDIKRNLQHHLLKTFIVEKYKILDILKKKKNVLDNYWETVISN
jgi:hypothetical protein